MERKRGYQRFFMFFLCDLPEIEEITEGQAHTSTQKLYRDISTGTAVFINRKRVNACEHMTKMASLESL